MEAIETRYPTPTIRVELHYDQDCQNPLTDWDHGVEFRELPNASRTARNYTGIDEFSNVYAASHALELPDFENTREFWDDSWREPWQNEHTAPSLKTFLDKHCAAWGLVNRNDYDGTLHLYQSDDDKRDMLKDADGIAFVSRPSFLQGWHGKPEGARLTRKLRTMAEERIQAVIDEYNRWAQGDCYGYIVETHNPACPYCEDANDPDTGCPCWDNAGDSCWGLIGHDYAQEELARVAQSYAGEEQPCPELTTP